MVQPELFDVPSKVRVFKSQASRSDGRLEVG